MKLPGTLEYLDRIREEYTILQNQVQSLRSDLDKSNQEREMLQRNHVMYYELAYNVNAEVHKQAEIVKRLSGILAHIVPLLPAEHQNSAMQAIERAKSISPQELQTILANNQMQQQQLAASMIPGMANLGSIMG